MVDAVNAQLDKLEREGRIPPEAARPLPYDPLRLPWEDRPSQPPPRGYHRPVVSTILGDDR